jgi:hypothetical protein
MRVARIALPLWLAVVLGAAPAIWIPATGAAQPDESEGTAGEEADNEAPGPTIYKWIDEHGVAHYTTDRRQIPRELRNRVGKLGPPNAALRRTPVEASAPPTTDRPVSDFDDGERWAVRDRSFQGPQDAWDEGDPYGSLPVPESGGDDVFVSENELEERRQRLEDIDAEIALLQTDIAASEEALKALLVVPIPEGGGPLAMADDPTFREVANRLPKLLSDLRALEDERAQLQAP